jgi:molybdenum cofactor cytidylyltransferase
MKLSQAFEIVRGDVVSLIGAGGKTSLMVALGYELAEMGWRVLAMTSVQTNAHQMDLMPTALKADAGAQKISNALSQSRFVFLYQSVVGDTLYGLGREAISRLPDTIDSDVILVEADTANGLSLKAPLPHEPNIPQETSLVIPVASTAVLGHPLDHQRVYNLETIVEKYGFVENSRIKGAWLAQILRDEELGLKGVPEGVRVVPFLNQTPTRNHARGRARIVARLILKSPRFHGVVIGSVRGKEQVYEVQRPVGAIVLAAGLSSRMGTSKMKLPWVGERSILQHVIDQLIKSRIDHITVVTGHEAREMRNHIKYMGVEDVFNKDYKTGEMLSSIKTGLSAMPANIAAALIVLGDQPRIQPKTIYQVMSAYAEGENDLIVPSFQMKRGHPVLIGRRYWNEILNLSEDGSLRDVMNAHASRIHYVNIDNDSILRDVDTPQDYREERGRAGL